MIAKSVEPYDIMLKIASPVKIHNVILWKYNIILIGLSERYVKALRILLLKTLSHYGGNL